MISIDSSLCAGCGTCVDACPQEAISLVQGQASIDESLCDDCGSCVQVCPNQALAMVIEPEMAVVPIPAARAITQSSTDVIDVGTVQSVPWRLAVRPAVGAFLSWAGHELVPRFVPLALDTLEAVLDRQRSRPGKDTREGAATVVSSGRGQQRRHRRRHGRTQK